jgi:hypothetical protein
VLNLLVVGAGSRGRHVFGRFVSLPNSGAKIIAVAEPDQEKREAMAREHNIPRERMYETGEEALIQEKFSDGVIITAPDKTHYKLALNALNQGYHVLLEKPMATSPEECIEIVKAQKKSGKVLSVAHVLRYTPFFKEIKERVDSGELGKLLSLDLQEEVGYWHYAHSFVRGNWRKKSESGPVILTKCCHDMDIISWLIPEKITSVFSTGSRKLFRRSNSPKGSRDRCIQDCNIKRDCPYNAERFYLSETEEENVGWPINVISPVDFSIAARENALKNGQYGRCVYKCDNDVCDNQEVWIRFKNGLRARFTMTAMGSESTRKIKLHFEKGEIHGDLGLGSIRIVKYSGVRRKDDIRQIDLDTKGGHGGGDEHMFQSFIKTIEKNNSDYNLTSAEASLQSHLLSFVAEDSRLNGKIINFPIYIKNNSFSSATLPKAL